MTTAGDVLTLVNVGQHNHHAGPDFFNAQLKIRDQLWAGNVEIHIKSSDWYRHNHETDLAYDSVILHVVYEHDIEIYRSDASVIPTLELKNHISIGLMDRYQNLLNGQNKYINCENELPLVDDFIINNWLESLYFERLEQKSKAIEQQLINSKNDWERVLFALLAKNFGLNVNGDSFLSMAISFDFSILRKIRDTPELLEALFFGQTGLLENEIEDVYQAKLKDEYLYLAQKFSLTNAHVTPLQFFRLRPPNFPTIRLSQLAMLYHSEANLFSKIISASSIKELHAILQVSTSPYWKDHYSFGKVSKSTKKVLTKSFIDLLIINTVLPLKFCYARLQGHSVNETILGMIQELKSEQNGIVEKFNDIRPMQPSALQSQAIIQLKTNYCDKNKCLQCAIGNSLLNITPFRNHK